jgi:hypothetical protein
MKSRTGSVSSGLTVEIATQRSGEIAQNTRFRATEGGVVFRTRVPRPLLATVTAAVKLSGDGPEPVFT